MSYDFSFEKKSIILIVSGCVTIGVLLFLAGFIVGLDKASGRSGGASRQQPPQNKAATKPPGGTDEAPAALQKPALDKREEPLPMTSGDSTKSLTSQGQPKPSLAGAGDSKGKEGESREQATFSLQLGAFQTEDNALKLRDNLKAKGYPVFLFRVLDGDGHIWHTVRMGHYPDMKKASQAAATFISKEQISAWVRPSNAL